MPSLLHSSNSSNVTLQNNKYNNLTLNVVDRNKEKNTNDLYIKQIIKTDITVPFITINNTINNTKNMNELIYKIISKKIEGKCIVDGYVKPNTTKIIDYSFGVINGKNVLFKVTYECYICNPNENIIIQCLSKNITQAGIRAVSLDDPSPVVIYISRDHHNSNSYFSSISEGDIINIKVVGKRFELNDSYVSIIGELIEPKKEKKLIKPKKITKLVLKEPSSPLNETCDIIINENK